MLDSGYQRGVSQSVGQLDSSDHMVEAAVRRSTWRDGAPFCIDNDMVGVNANLAKHGAEESSLVLTVAVPMRKNLSCGMGLPATDTELDTDITNVALDERGESLHFFQSGGFRRSQRSDLLFDFRRRVRATPDQIDIPLTHLVPVGKAI